MMGKFYIVLLTVILAFPWSVVGLMIMGAIWERGKVGARPRPEGEKARTPGEPPGSPCLTQQK